MAKKLANLFGVIFLLVGLLGFVSNPIVGEMGYFQTDLLHNLVHLLAGLILLIAAAKGAASLWLKILGVIYLLIGLLGLMVLDESGMGWVLGFLEVNSADNWLHLILGIILLLGGFSKGKEVMASPSMGGQM